MVPSSLDFSLTFFTVGTALVVAQADNAVSSKKLPSKPSPAPGARNPQENIPFSATVNGEPVSSFSGISYKVLTLAADTLNKTLYLTAKAANVSFDRVLAPWAAIAGIRFGTWYPLGGANLAVPIEQFYLWPQVETVAGRIGQAIVESVFPLCADDEAAYLSNTDYVGNVHHGFNTDPALTRIMDLGLWLKFIIPQVLSSRFLFPISEWTSDMEEAMRIVYRYVVVDDWHYIDFYSRKCLSRGQRDDGARVKN